MKFVDATFTYRAVTLKTLSWSMTFIYPSAGGKKGAGGGVNRITHLLAASNKIQYFGFFLITGVLSYGDTVCTRPKCHCRQASL